MKSGKFLELAAKDETNKFWPFIASSCFAAEIKSIPLA
jgi:hypothetical protein